MNNKIARLLLCALLSTSFGHNIYATTPAKNFWESVAVVGTAIAAGIGAYTLLDWCLTETNEQLFERAEREYKDTLRFVEDGVLEEFERFHNLSRITMSETYSQQYNFHFITTVDKHSVLNFTSEAMLYTLARTWFDRGIICRMYIDDVVNTEYQLDSLSKTLHRRIDESKGKHLSSDDARYINAMRSIVKDIDAYTSHISLFSDYLTQHKTYFIMFDCEADVYKKYDDLLRIVGSSTSYNMKINDILRYVMWQYSAYTYPYIAFVYDVKADLILLKDTIKTLCYRYPERMRYARELIETLEWIKKIIISDPCYAQEKMDQYEQERLERLRRETLKEQRRLERALDAARKEHQKLCLTSKL